jgi:D-alanine-D-alanine ligase
MVNRRIVVLMGGMSRERNISLETGNAVSAVLGKLGHDFTTLDVGSDIVEKLTELKVNGEVGVVFNALHGRYGEDGCVQGLCELLKIPYTHSGVLSSALAMNKIVSKQMFRKAGIPVPEGDICPVRKVFTEQFQFFPFVIKPIDEGSSLGVHVVKDKSHAIMGQPFWNGLKDVMVEEYIPGRELTVAIMDERSLEVLEIKPKQDFYDFESKYTPGQAEYLIPAPLSADVREEILHYAQLAHVTLGCSGVTRADFRYDESRRNEGIKLLEINTQPGLTPTSLVPQIAAYAGLTFDALVDWMVRNARCNV